MMNKLIKNTGIAAGFAALLLVGACASTDTVATNDHDDLVHVTESNSVAPATGPALVDSDGNIYASSAAPGSGNASSVGTNTNVNIIPQRTDATMTSSSNLNTTGTVETTTRIESTTAPVTTDVSMTSSSSIDTQETTSTTTTTSTRTRMRKD